MLTGASRPLGALACLAGVAAGWARVYLGIHFPVDVLAAAHIGLLVALAAVLATPVMRGWIVPLVERLYEAVVAKLPAHPSVLRRGPSCQGGGHR